MTDRCCNRPDPELIGDEGYECLECGRVLGHRLPEWKHEPDWRALYVAGDITSPDGRNVMHELAKLNERNREHATFTDEPHQTTRREVPHYPRDPGHIKWCPDCKAVASYIVSDDSGARYVQGSGTYMDGSEYYGSQEFEDEHGQTFAQFMEALEAKVPEAEKEGRLYREG